MSNFTDFFESGGGGGIVATPADLPRSNARSNQLWIKTSKTAKNNSETELFWDVYSKHYATSIIPSGITNYTTLVDVSNSLGGVLYHIIAPSNYHGNISHSISIKITLDGEVTEIGPINMNTNQYRAFHPVLGALIDVFPSDQTSDSNTSLSTYYQYFDNDNNHKQSHGFWASNNEQAFTIPTPSQADLLPKIKFNSTLKVEVKGYLSATYNANRAGCAYKLY